MNGKHAGKVNAKELVLLTGADGYVATEIALQYMEAGFRVRGTFLSQARAEAWVKVHQIQHLFEAVVTKDMVEEDAYDQVMEGVTIVVHTASPVSVFSVPSDHHRLVPETSSIPRFDTKQTTGLSQLQRPGEGDVGTSRSWHSPHPQVSP